YPLPYLKVCKVSQGKELSLDLQVRIKCGSPAWMPGSRQLFPDLKITGASRGSCGKHQFTWSLEVQFCRRLFESAWWTMAVSSTKYAPTPEHRSSIPGHTLKMYMRACRSERQFGP